MVLAGLDAYLMVYGLVSCWCGVMETGQGQKASHEHTGIKVAKKSLFALSGFGIGKLYLRYVKLHVSKATVNCKYNVYVLFTFG